MREDRLAEFKYTDLVNNPRATIETIYLRFGMEMTDDVAKRMDEACGAARRYESSHSYDLAQFGLTEADIDAALPEIFDTYGLRRSQSKA